MIRYFSLGIVSFLISKFLFLKYLQKYLTNLQIYIIILSLLTLIHLLCQFQFFSINFNIILLIFDSLLTGIFVSLLMFIYTSKSCIFHILFICILISISNLFHISQLKHRFFFDKFIQNLLLILINIFHMIYSYLNGLQTYMHRLLALTGMCLSFYLIIFVRIRIDFEYLSLSINDRHFLQSIRTFFLYSVVICVRNRTSYW